MKQQYDDIIDRLGVPKWWDEHGVPRYCAPSPDVVANIYAHEVAFCLIKCQACGFPFLVAMSRARHEIHYEPSGLSGAWILKPKPPLSEQINSLHYGDPPSFFWYGDGKVRPGGEPYPRCCHAGATMNSDMVGVIRFYRRASNHFDWDRLTEFEHKCPEFAEYQQLSLFAELQSMLPRHIPT